MACLRDLRRDWRRWKPSERIAALSIVAAMMAVIAATLIVAPFV